MRFPIAALVAGTVVFASRAVCAAQGPPGDRAAGIQFAGIALAESWDKNGSSETLLGGTMSLTGPLRGRWGGAIETIFLRVAEEEFPDPYLAGVTLLLRRELFRAGRSAVFVEAGPGISYASRIAPPGGTRMNYLAQAGAGALIRIGPGAYFVPGIRYLHISNNSLAGRGRNPDIQAIGVYIGTMVTF